MDAIADIIGDDVAAKLIAKVKPDGLVWLHRRIAGKGQASKNPTVKIMRSVRSLIHPSVREFADDVRDGVSFCLLVAGCQSA